MEAEIRYTGKGMPTIASKRTEIMGESWNRFSSRVHPQSVQSCLTLCDPMDYSTPGLPVHHQLLELAQTHVHWVSNAIQPFHPLLPPSPSALHLFQHHGLFHGMTEKLLKEPISQMVLKYCMAGNITLANFLSDLFVSHSICATYNFFLIFFFLYVDHFKSLYWILLQ